MSANSLISCFLNADKFITKLLKGVDGELKYFVLYSRPRCSCGV